MMASAGRTLLHRLQSGASVQARASLLPASVFRDLALCHAKCLAPSPKTIYSVHKISPRPLEETARAVNCSESRSLHASVDSQTDNSSGRKVPDRDHITEHSAKATYHKLCVFIYGCLPPGTLRNPAEVDKKYIMRTAPRFSGQLTACQSFLRRVTPSPLEEMGVFINDSLLMSREDCVRREGRQEG